MVVGKEARELVEAHDAVARRVHKLCHTVHVRVRDVLEVEHAREPFAKLTEIARVALVLVDESEGPAKGLEARIQLALEQVVVLGKLVAHGHDLGILCLLTFQEWRGIDPHAVVLWAGRFACASLICFSHGTLERSLSRRELKPRALLASYPIRTRCCMPLMDFLRHQGWQRDACTDRLGRTVARR